MITSGNTIKSFCRENVSKSRFDLKILKEAWNKKKKTTPVMALFNGQPTCQNMLRQDNEPQVASNTVSSGCKCVSENAQTVVMTTRKALYSIY